MCIKACAAQGGFLQLQPSSERSLRHGGIALHSLMRRIRLRTLEANFFKIIRKERVFLIPPHKNDYKAKLNQFVQQVVVTEQILMLAN